MTTVVATIHNHHPGSGHRQDGTAKISTAWRGQFSCSSMDFSNDSKEMQSTEDDMETPKRSPVTETEKWVDRRQAKSRDKEGARAK